MLPYKGIVDIDNKIINWQTTFDQSVKFKCIKCGLSCIGADVQVSEKEIEKIKNVSGKDFFEEYTTPFGNKRKRLKKIGNRCVFLDDNLNCTIYENRPLLCREYPFKVLFTAKNNAIIDLTYHCGCIIRKEFTKENEVDFGKLVREHHVNSPEDTEDLEMFEEIVRNVKRNLDSSEAVRKCWSFIVDRLVSPLEHCALIVNFQKAREEFKFLNFSNVDKYIASAMKKDYPEIDWNEFMRKFAKRVSSEGNNFNGIEPSSQKKYRVYVNGETFEFRYYFSDERISVSLEDAERKVITPEGLDILRKFLNEFWDRAVTSYDFYLAMDYLRDKIGAFPPSIIIQLDAGRFVLHCFEFFLNVIAEKNKHDEINEEDVKEAIVLLDGAFLTVTSGILPG